MLDQDVGKALQELNPTREMDPVGHDVVALVGQLSEADKAMLAQVLGEGFIFRPYVSPGRISVSTRSQLALVVVGELGSAERQELSEMLNVPEGQAPLVQRVPMVATYKPAEGAGEIAKDGRVDGILASPTDIHGGIDGMRFGLLAAVKFCTERFMEAEGVRAAEAIKGFVNEYIALFTGYAKDIKELSFFTRAVEPTEIETVLTSAERAAEILKQIRSQAERGGCDAGTMGRIGYFCHELNNVLTVLITYAGFAIEELSDSVPAQEAAFLRSVETGGKRLAHDCVAIQNVLGRCYSWLEFQMGNVPGGSFAKAELEVPQGLNVCIIEDNEDLARAMVKQATKKGGRATVARNKAELLALLTLGGVVPDVFILDNELADGDYGHKLVSFIQVAAPGALIVVHTADLVALSKTPELYGDLPMVGKLDFAAINELIAKRFPPKA